MSKQNITADLASLFGVDANGKIISLTIDSVNSTNPVANATHAVQASVAETVTANAQPNITSLGTLTSLTAGDVTVTGNLLVQGNTVTVGATELSVSDLNITIANGAPNAAAANGAGITIDGANLTLTYDSTSNALVSSHNVSAPNVDGAYLNGTHVGGGQELVFNEDTVPLVKGDIVRVSGAQGNTIAVRKASNAGEGTSAGTLGIVTQTIAVGATGLVHTSGSFSKLDTSALTEGALVFLGVGGAWTTTKPQAPAHTVILGWVERVHATVGSIYVKVDNGYELDELHNVKITSPTAGQFLSYDSANAVWVNQTVAQYSPKKYSKEYHVDPANGDDTAAGGSETPFKTITAALTHVTNGGDALILHPGTYSEAVTVTTLNLDIIGRTGGGGIVNLSGAWTYNVASGSIRVEGVNHSGAVTISNASSFYARKSLFTGGITKGGSGYVDITDCDAQSANALTVTGSGIVAFNGGLQAAIVVNNASATVTVANSKNLTSATVTNGTLVVNDSYIFSASNTTAAITSAVGTVVYLQNSRIVKPNQTAGFVTLAGIYSMTNMSYDHANSTLGTRLATTSYFDALHAGSGNITANIVTGNSVYGTLRTSAQPNITSLGNLTSLVVSGTSNLGAVGNITITGGANGQVLSTNGNGVLSFVAQPNLAPYALTTYVDNAIANTVPLATYNTHVSDQANTVANLVTTTTYTAYVNTTANTIANLTTKTYVDGAIANLVGSAPDALNTLSEIANALGSDANLSATLTASIGNTNSNVANLANTVSILTTDTANSFTSTNSNVSNLSNTTTASFTSTNSNVANLANTVSNLSNTTTASFTSTNGNVANLITENNATHTAIRNRILLSGGFLLTEGTAVGNRTPYTGSLIGETSTSYWFDTGDDKWYDASTGGNVLIGY
jgi:hypothetical protein